MGARLTWTSNTDMKILICRVRPGHTSPSFTSLICTTVPSAGERTSTWRSEPRRCGSRKKLSRKRERKPKTIAAIHHWMSSESAVRITAGMMNSQPSGAKRTLGMLDTMQTEFRRQKAEGRRQKAEGRRQKAEGRNLKCRMQN